MGVTQSSRETSFLLASLVGIVFLYVLQEHSAFLESVEVCSFLRMVSGWACIITVWAREQKCMALLCSMHDVTVAAF